jgi:hypothetical protein
MAALLTVTLSGCVIAIGGGGSDHDDGWKERQTRNSDYIRSLRLGQSRASTEADLGRADFIESFVRDGDEFTVLYYRTERVRDDGVTTIDETTPLVFVEGELVGWGHTAIDKATRR